MFLPLMLLFIHNSGYGRQHHILILGMYGPYYFLERCLSGLSLTHKLGSSQTNWVLTFPMTSRCAVTGNKCNVHEQRPIKAEEIQGTRFPNIKLQLLCGIGDS